MHYAHVILSKVIHFVHFMMMMEILTLWSPISNNHVVI